MHTHPQILLYYSYTNMCTHIYLSIYTCIHSYIHQLYTLYITIHIIYIYIYLTNVFVSPTYLTNLSRPCFSTKNCRSTPAGCSETDKVHYIHCCSSRCRDLIKLTALPPGQRMETRGLLGIQFPPSSKFPFK